MFKGEHKHGRFIFLEELNNNKIKLTFIRFINKITNSKIKLIGFEITDAKSNIYNLMLRCIRDFTMPFSISRLYLKRLNGDFLTKTYYNKVQNPFFINGETYVNENGKTTNNIFKKRNNTIFQENLD